MQQKTPLLEKFITDNIANAHHQTNSSPRAAILICQSIEENIEDYSLFCNYLANENIAIYIYNYLDAKKTSNNIYYETTKHNKCKTITQYVMELRKSISENHGNIPVFLLGYSFGTIIALSTIIKYPKEFSGIVIWNPDLYFEKYNCLITEIILKAEKFFKGSDTPSRFMRHITSNIMARNIKNWQCFLNESLLDLESSVDTTKHNRDSYNLPISIWLELISLANNINSAGSFNQICRSKSFLLIGGGNVTKEVEDYSQIQSLSARLYKEEFYDVSLIILPPDQINQSKNKTPNKTIKEIHNWIFKSYLPKVTPLIEFYKQ